MKLPTPPRLTALVLVVVLAVMLAACGKGGAEGQGHGAGGGMPPTIVAVKEVQPATVPVEFEYPAQTAGSREAEVRARVPGLILRRNYEEGATVRAGQSLYQLDSATYEAAVARAEADVSAAEARFSAAQRNAARTKPLLAARAASQKDVDDAVSAEEVAAADVKAAKARLREARLNLEYTRVESPIHGLTSRSLKSEGSLVNGPQDLLTTVSQLDPIWINFGVSEAEQSRIRQDVASGKLEVPKDYKFDVAIRFESGKVYSRPGKLVFTDARVNAQTGTTDARAEVPNPAGEVRPGQFVRVVLKGAQRPNAIAVPQRALVEGPQGKMVYVLSKDGKAEPRPVTVGEWSGSDWIIGSGLAPGDKVIVDGIAKIFFPGQPVQVGDPNAPPPGAPGGPGGAPGKGDSKGDGKAAPPKGDAQPKKG
jgi:membrane fusion protein (multidrug efflux system)